MSAQNLAMTCPELSKLEMDHKIAQDNVLLFRSANKAIHSQSKRVTDQHRKHAQERAFELADEIP
jgi:hypothetical protein